MSKLMKLNIMHTFVWSVVTIGVAIIFGMRGTVQSWGDEPAKVAITAALFAAAFIIDAFLRISEKSKKHNIIKDERDDTIQLQAVFKSFAVVLLYIFALCVVLYLKYENQGYAPVGWLWFMAYSTISSANLFVGLFSIAGYRKAGS